MHYLQPKSKESFGNASFCKDFFKRLLLFWRTRSVSLHRLIRALMCSFPAAFVAPSRNKGYPDTFFHSPELVTYTHKRSKPCCTSEQLALSTLPWCGAQLMIQANHCPSPWPCIPTHCHNISSLLPRTSWRLTHRLRPRTVDARPSCWTAYQLKPDHRQAAYQLTP
jgi:hypothetical protein